ncbi:MhmaT1 transposase [Oopsacas minuta]|uniref:MhmaT1 transposase n=1 Tax=Oopsacas minuta TaxID=111878 RepID=A0AAV7JUK2_9METZ|nr:MhmaT1 transposase [Oopsacas minuta]
MVWAGISSVGRKLLVFVPFGVKINAATCKELILEPFVKDLGKTMFENGSFAFQQDGAAAHKAKSTQEWLGVNIPHFITKVEWPPSSPDPNPLDFSLWSILESRAC